MGVFILYLVVGFPIIFIICLQILTHRHSSTNLPPGSTGWPFLGETLEFLSTGWKGHPETFVLDRMIKYTSECFKTNIYKQNMVVFCGPQGNKFLFMNKLVTTWWPDSLDKIFPSNLQSDSNEESIKMRKLLLHVLKPDALQKYIGIMDTVAQRHFASEWDNKDQVFVSPLVKKYTFWLACRVFISKDDPSYIPKFAQQFNYILTGMLSIPIDFPGTTYNKAIKGAKFIRKEIMKISQQRKVELAEGKATETQDMLSHMLSIRDENGEFMNDLEIADKIMGLLVGGHDTSSSTITFIVNYLAELPHVYDAVYEEQMEVAKSKAEGELLNWEDISRMKYSWNVVCEVLRLIPPLQGAFREAQSEFMYAGFTIPKGWKLFWSVYSTHLDPRYFPEPEKFDPTRYEGRGPAPYTYVPFGGGPRMCPGKEYARLQILVFVHNLVKRFKLEKIIPDEKVTFTPISTPVNMLPIRLIPHNMNL